MEWALINGFERVTAQVARSSKQTAVWFAANDIFASKESVIEAAQVFLAASKRASDLGMPFHHNFFQGG